MATAANPTLERARSSASDPAKDAVEFTGTADVTLTTHSRGIYIASAGTLKVDMIGYSEGAVGATVTFSGLTAGSVLPICVSKIYDTGTTVSGVILL